MMKTYMVTLVTSRMYQEEIRVFTSIDECIEHVKTMTKPNSIKGWSPKITRSYRENMKLKHGKSSIAYHGPTIFELSSSDKPKKLDFFWEWNYTTKTWEQY